jgi:glutamate-ammonia-ligase adenylyltransferase
VFAGSPFLHRVSDRDPAFLVRCLTEDTEAVFEAVLRDIRAASSLASTREVMSALRTCRNRLALLIGLADLAGAWPVDTVVARLSEAAEASIEAALRFLLRAAAASGKYRPFDPDAPEKGCGLIVLAMGKLGARELNYSSDIDLVVFFDADRALERGIGEPQAFFVRLVRDLVRILQEQTIDGYVYRTDLRLRPDPASTQAAISTEAAYIYYETQGQNWERAAFIKARPVAGDLDAGETFLKALSPFIWRKFLDYNAIADVHAMKRQIHAAKGHDAVAVLGHNIKLGRGGIREIEFFVQCQQLIGGGRQAALRTRETLTGLDRLLEFEWIDAATRDELAAAYRFLRTIEHRLQMVADQQTHTLPADKAAFTTFAYFCGYEDGDGLRRDLCQHMQRVEQAYASLFEDAPQGLETPIGSNLVFTGDEDDPDTVKTLQTLGFHNPSAVIASVKGWQYGRYRSMRTTRVREILTEFAPAFLTALGRTADPDRALATFDRYLSELPAGVQVFSLLRANPALLDLVAQIMGSAPRLAQVLARRRHLLDAVLDPGDMGDGKLPLPNAHGFGEAIASAGAYEQQLDRARILGQEHAFLIGVALLRGDIDARSAARCYSELASTVVAAMTACVQREFGGGREPPAVLAMGKLGGCEMTATSDVDLIVVYADQPGTNAQQHYARFTQRLIAALSAPTAEGFLYNVDMRLRPSGRAGPVAVSLDGFLAYQRHDAWTWEHLALTRARPVARPASLTRLLEEGIASVLSMLRDQSKAAADVSAMRALLAKEKPATSIWDVVRHAGGLTDIEFVTQFLQIVSGGRALRRNTRRALEALAQEGMIDAETKDVLCNAHDLYTTVLQITRLGLGDQGNLSAAPQGLPDLIVRQTGCADMDELQSRLGDAYARITPIVSDTLSAFSSSSNGDGKR